VKFSQVRLLVDELGPSFRFYRDVLGLVPSFGDEGDDYASFSFADGASQLALFVRNGQGAVVELRQPGDGVVVCLAVDDLDAEVARVSAAGGSFVAEPSEQPEWGIRVAYLRDPAGNLVELHETIDA
jgi:lactoylglutathione lyase